MAIGVNLPKIRPTAFEIFSRPLLRLAFRKKWDSRAGGVRVSEWKREEEDGRTLVCQIWEDGKCRLSHEWLGCSDTVPTDFSDEEELVKAIEYETIRKDSRYRDPNNHHVPEAREFLLRKQADITEGHSENGHRG